MKYKKIEQNRMFCELQKNKENFTSKEPCKVLSFLSTKE